MNFAMVVLCLTLIYECGGEERRGQELVASVINNRVLDSLAKDVSLKSDGSMLQEAILRVLLAPKQFSCWNNDSPSYQELDALRSGGLKYITELEVMAIKIYNTLLFGKNEYTNHGINYFHTSNTTPYWSLSPKMELIEEVGNHKFYRDRHYE